MPIENVQDHNVLTKVVSTVDETGEKIEGVALNVELELKKLFGDAKKAGAFIVSHTVTYMHDLEAVVLSVHTVKG